MPLCLDPVPHVSCDGGADERRESGSTQGLRRQPPQVGRAAAGRPHPARGRRDRPANRTAQPRRLVPLL